MPVKFTKAQLAFLAVKFNILNTDELVAEALAFSPEKKRVAKEVPAEERCISIKKDGKQCTKRAKENEMCPVHLRQAFKLKEKLIEKSPEFVEIEA